LGILIRSQPVTSPHARLLIATYLGEVASRLPDGFDPTRSVSANDDELTPPKGDFLVIVDTESETFLGCAGIKWQLPGQMEIKRMWIHPDYRGQGLGRRLLSAVEERARKLGASELVLDTNAELREAVSLYDSAGYLETAPYNDNRYASLWLKKELSAPDSAKEREVEPLDAEDHA
jgi:GNAT superfamily N-acetyltransferase